VCFNESKVLYSRKPTVVLLAIGGTLSLQHLPQSLYSTKTGFLFCWEKSRLFPSWPSTGTEAVFCGRHGHETEGFEMKKGEVFLTMPEQTLFS